MSLIISGSGQGAGANANTGTPNQQQNWGGWGRPTGQAPWGWPNQQPQQPAQQMDPNMMMMLMMVMNKAKVYRLIIC